VVGFAAGAMVNEGLKLIQWADDALHCAANAADAALHASLIVFIFVQLHFIFTHSQVVLGFCNSLYELQLILVTHRCLGKTESLSFLR